MYIYICILYLYIFNKYIYIYIVKYIYICVCVYHIYVYIICGRAFVCLFLLSYRLRSVIEPRRFNPWLHSAVMESLAGDRTQLVQTLAETIFESFLKPDGGEWLRKTGQLLKVNMFNRLIEIGKVAAQRRLWTESLLRGFLFTLLQKRQLFSPVTHDFTIESWVKEQAQKLHKLARKAAKNQWQQKRGRSKSAKDNAQTQACLEDCQSKLNIHHMPMENSSKKSPVVESCSTYCPGAGVAMGL